MSLVFKTYLPPAFTTVPVKAVPWLFCVEEEEESWDGELGWVLGLVCCPFCVSEVGCCELGCAVWSCWAEPTAESAIASAIVAITVISFFISRCLRIFGLLYCALF